MDWAQQAWPQEDAKSNAKTMPPSAPVDELTFVLASAKSSQSKERPFKSMLVPAADDPSLSVSMLVSETYVRSWLAGNKERTHDKGRHVFNQMQDERVNRVAHRICEDMLRFTHTNAFETEP